ncbi:lycopene cyclase domain-containing protein [Acaricomes phytoseiuli]|uniref:lycopene cyclase domain-containing protein n=1 Tax=Acaricomes phytoseiuli TaxID=291968 RepID=UPI00036137F7|nr:lycopene cyclase domain-containing protein [Acaricomes phytoseiuli]MCW1248676.1 lycopene cyclase domain-containing protein [Acaricomes phytoseiuli]
MRFLYLLCLGVSTLGMILIDWRHRLVFWKNWRRSALVLALGVLFFILWDLAGIGLGIFFRGGSPWMTGIELLPELPLEEPIFLFFLCYLTLVLLSGAQQLRNRKNRGSEPAPHPADPGGEQR